MKKILVAALALLASVSVASAQDVRADRNGLYIGGAVGSSLRDNSQTAVGAAVGYQFHPNFRVEAAYDLDPRTNRDNGHLLMANAIAQYRIPTSVVTPYVLAGAGMGFDTYGKAANGDVTAVYNVGGGVRLAVSTNVELDARYRYIGHFDNAPGLQSANMFTVGANWRF